MVCVFFSWSYLSAFQKPDSLPTVIKIGLLIESDNLIEAKKGAEIAVDKINNNGGIKGVPIQLVTQSMEGSWGTGSKQAVNMVFKEKVWAILGSHNSKNAHLVEQASAKTQTIFLSAWASDPSLSQAYVPWFFNIVPNNNQQANALINKLYNNKNFSNLAVISNSQYDYDLAVKGFLKTIKNKGLKQPKQYVVSGSNTNFQSILDKLKRDAINGVVLFTKPSFAANFIKKLKKNGMILPVFGTLFLLDEEVGINYENLEYSNLTLLASGNWLENRDLYFKKSFQNKNGKKPSIVAAYAYDGMKILIEAIKTSNFDVTKLQEVISKIKYKGVTGTIEFDNRGNRINAVRLMEIN